jgi:hypothetical protein
MGAAWISPRGEEDHKICLRTYYCALKLDSSVGIATGYKLDDLGCIPGRARFFFSPQRGGASYPVGTGR